MEAVNQNPVEIIGGGLRAASFLVWPSPSRPRGPSFPRSGAVDIARRLFYRLHYVARRAIRLIAGIAVSVPGLTVAAVSAAVILASLIFERMTGAVPVEQRAES